MARWPWGHSPSRSAHDDDVCEAQQGKDATGKTDGEGARAAAAEAGPQGRAAPDPGVRSGPGRHHPRPAADGVRMMWRQSREVTRRTAERRQREDDAPRLAVTIPALQ